MSWLSSLQDGLKNAEALLNSVDAKAKEVAVVQSNPGAGDRKLQEGLREGQAARSQVSPPSPPPQQSSGRAGHHAERKTFQSASDAQARASFASPRPSHTKRANGATPRSGAGARPVRVATPSKGAEAVEEKSFSDLTAMLSTSEEETKSTPRVDPRLMALPQPPVAAASPRTKPKHEGGAAGTGAKPPPPPESAFPSPPVESKQVELPKQVRDPPQGVGKEQGGASLGQEKSKSESLPPVPSNASADASNDNADRASASVVVEGAKVAEEPAAAAAVEEKVSSADESGARKVVGGSQEQEIQAEKEGGSGSLPPPPSSPTPALASVSDARAQMRKKLEGEIKEAESLAMTSKAPSTSGAPKASGKEARLSAMCERLSSRLQQYKVENEQLEEMLKEAERGKENVEKAVGEMREHKQALASKEREISELKAKLRDAAEARESDQVEIQSLRGEHDDLAKKMSNSEMRVLSAAREELNVVELRLETERKAHKATKETALKREQDLEAHVSENTAALATMQRRLDERSERVAHLEQANASLEQNYSELSREISDKERREKHLVASKEDKEQKLQSSQQTLLKVEKEAEDLRKETSTAKARVAELEAEIEKMNSERKLGSEEESSSKEKLNEMTDLLYQKQEQLEKLASDKAAIQMSLEKELNGLKQELQQTKSINSNITRRGQAFDIEDVVPIESMKMYDRLAKNRRVGNYLKKGAQALDFSTSTVVGLLKQQPIVRIGLFAYIMLIHFYLYWVMYRLSSKAVPMTDPGEMIRSQEG
ncbi:golgin-like protein [Chloropicon primus]|uniref:Golgin-like protein n=2 Tax=Chloropicon primus TaxID=1764295 RepID=A0A5B8MLT1_9CHLO|nr:golgin-like protein [Chloropicon primus]UPR00613.1 golgin-like protein [Chloropicon primus]|eukprot:QDZ21399.1 golgin-like protein [Chloropicon primus]